MKITRYIPLFNTKVVIYLGEEEIPSYKKASAQLLGRNDINDTLPNLVNINGNSCGSFIWLRTASLAVFAHEMTHCISEVMEHVGTECEEVRAYMMQWSIDVLWLLIKKK